MMMVEEASMDNIPFIIVLHYSFFSSIAIPILQCEKQVVYICGTINSEKDSSYSIGYRIKMTMSFFPCSKY